MKVKNFKFKKIKIYIKNLIFKVNKSIFEDESEKNINKINKIMRNTNISNIDTKLKKINDIFKKSYPDPMVCREVSSYEIDQAKNPEIGFNKMKKYNYLKNSWLKENNLENLKTKFIQPSVVTGSLGNHSQLFYYIKYKENFEGTNNKPNILLSKDQTLTNSTLYNYFSPYLNTIRNNSLYYKLDYISKISTIPMQGTLPFQEHHYPAYVTMNLINQTIKKEKNPKFNYFKISQTDYEKGKSLLKKIGLPDNAWYVTLHVRGGVGNELFNANPSTYLKAIKEITRRGGYVFRVGDKKMKKLPKIDGLIDYPFTDFKSEFFDIFLASTCRFCIGTSSGYWSIPTFFGRPVLLTNYIPHLDYYILEEKSFFLPKRLIDVKTKERIGIENSFSLPLGCMATNVHLEQNSIEALDNNEDEILQSTIEILDSFENEIDSQKDKHFNEEFKKKLDDLNYKKYETPLKALGNISTVFLKD